MLFSKGSTRWLNFDVHGRIGIRVARNSPAAPQLQTMLACFATDREVPGDIVLTEEFEPMPDAAVLEDELSYTENAVRFRRDRVQIVFDRTQYRIHGAGELLTSLVPVLDRAMVTRGAAMIHAATPTGARPSPCPRPAAPARRAPLPSCSSGTASPCWVTIGHS